MEYRKLGKSDVEVSVLAFGAWAIGGWMWGGADSRQAVQAIETAIDLGMTSIDTAPVYGFGLSEELVGKAIRGKRDKIQLLTKFGMLWNEKKGKFFFASKDNNGKDIEIYRYSSKERVISDCDESLRRLGTDYIDLFQIHWPDPTTPVDETMEALALLQQKGKIRAGAVCNYSLDLLKEAEKSYPLASNQVPYSMVNRQIEKDVVPYCMENGIGILAYSPLQRGLLTGKIRPGHHFNEGDSRPGTPYYKEPNLSNILHFLETITPVAERNHLSTAQLVLNWTIHQPGITCALAGARSPEQVKENIIAADARISEEDNQFIHKELSKLTIDSSI